MIKSISYIRQQTMVPCRMTERKPVNQYTTFDR